ncbi:MAG: hypothetical protein AAGA29_08050 [Planctomycetota bacterium]
MTDPTPLLQAHNDGFEAWRFIATPCEAQRVYLVLDDGVGPTRWIEMQPVVGRPGQWDATANLKPGHHRARYFTSNDGAYLNCGNFGLSAQRTSGPCPGVSLEPLEALAA